MNKINFYIFKVNFKNIIFNKVFITMFFIFISLSMVMELISFANYFDLSNKYITDVDHLFNSVFFFKKIFDVVFLSVIFIYITSLLFSRDIKEGKTDLEMKGGIGVFQTFIQRCTIILFCIVIVVVSNFILQSILTFTISNLFIESKLKLISFLGYQFLIVFLISTFTFLTLMIMDNKFALCLMGIIACVVSVSHVIGSTVYTKNSELYNYETNYFTLYKRNDFYKKITQDENFKDIFTKFEKVYDHTKQDEKIKQYQFGNYEYILNNERELAESLFGKNYIDFIDYLNQVFSEHYKEFRNYDDRGFKIEDTYVYNYRRGYNPLYIRTRNPLYVILNKIIKLSSDVKYLNFLNILKDYSNDYLAFMDFYSSNGSYDSRSDFDHFIKTRYFESTLKSYKTPDQLDLYYFISSIFFTITNSNINFRKNFEEGKIEELTPPKESLELLKKVAKYNPFNQLSQLQFGNYYSQNYKYYYDTFSFSSKQKNFESPIMPLQYKYLKKSSNTEGPYKIGELEEVTVEPINYTYLYFMYLLILTIVWTLTYFRYKRIFKN